MNLFDLDLKHLFLPLTRLVDLWVLCAVTIYAGCYIFQLLSAFIEVRRTLRQGKSVTPWWLLTSKVNLPISICVPAYNEEKSIVESTRSLLGLHYPDFEVIIANDGSKDNTLKVMTEAFDLKPVRRVYPHSVPCAKIRGVYASARYSRLTVVDKENGRRADAINAALNLARNPLVCVVDADSMLEPDALLRLVRPFILEPEEMVAAGGKIRVVNGCEIRSGHVVKVGLASRLVPLFQTIEYIRSFQIARLSWSRIQSVMIVSGAFGLFKRDLVLKVGGYFHATVGEDFELVVRIHRYCHDHKIRYKICYLPDPVCWTEVPPNLKILRSQRVRWARGMLEVLWRHRGMIFRPKYGLPGVYGLGYFFIFDAVGPFFEGLGYIVIPTCWLLGVLNTQFFLAFMGLLFIFGVFVSVGSLFLEELGSTEKSSPKDLAILTLCAFAENFGYRQLNTLWRIEGWWHFLQKKQGWGTMTRAGFTQKPAGAG
jgi:cellulose synthase/poly-beta-1,6-N-acetylglucosamine synthase-like glycosyltransferase